MITDPKEGLELETTLEFRIETHGQSLSPFCLLQSVDQGRN